MNILTNLKKELGYANVTNQYIELTARSFQIDHRKECLQKRARMVNLSISELPENYTTRIAKGYIIGVHSCVEHFLWKYRLLAGSPVHGYDYRPEDDDNRLKWTLEICYGNSIPHDVKQLYFICNYYRLARNEIVHIGSGSNELRQARSQLHNLDKELLLSGMCGRLDAPNDLVHLNFDDQVLFSRAARTICERIYRDSKYDWDSVFDYYRNTINGFLRNNDPLGKKKARISNFVSQMYPVDENNQYYTDSINRFLN